MTPSVVSNLAAHALFADSVDLDCNGTADYIGQIVSRQGGRLTLVAAVRRETHFEVVLEAPSPVDGPELPVLAANLAGTGKRDLVVLGSDEGGYVARVFRWVNDKYAPVSVPLQYTLRHEPDWGPDCLSRIPPRLVGNGRITMLRETISPSSARGHGADCSLPLDTLQIRGDSLVRVH